MLLSKLSPRSGKEYEVVPHGFRPDALQYVDRGYTFASIPDSLMNLTYVKTSGSDKMYEEQEECLRFDADCPVTVYVLHADKFSVKPKWLHEFKPTGQKVLRMDANKETMKGIFSVFARDFESGTIRLGGCLPPGMLTDDFVMSGGATYCMYSVVVASRR